MLSPEYHSKDNYAGSKLRKLLEEQTFINERLIDENELLSAQQKSLLNLLIAKDKQLNSFENSRISPQRSVELIQCGTQTLSLKVIQKKVYALLREALIKLKKYNKGPVQQSNSQQRIIKKPNCGTQTYKFDGLSTLIYRRIRDALVQMQRYGFILNGNFERKEQVFRDIQVHQTELGIDIRENSNRGMASQQVIEKQPIQQALTQQNSTQTLKIEALQKLGQQILKDAFLSLYRYTYIRPIKTIEMLDFQTQTIFIEPFQRPLYNLLRESFRKIHQFGFTNSFTPLNSQLIQLRLTSIKAIITKHIHSAFIILITNCNKIQLYKSTKTQKHLLALSRLQTILRQKQTNILYKCFNTFLQTNSPNTSLLLLLRQKYIENMRKCYFNLLLFSQSKLALEDKRKQKTNLLLRLSSFLHLKPQLRKLGFVKWRQYLQKWQKLASFLRFLSLSSHKIKQKALKNWNNRTLILIQNASSQLQAKSSKFAFTIEKIGGKLKERRRNIIRRRFKLWGELIKVVKFKRSATRVINRVLYKKCKLTFQECFLTKRHLNGLLGYVIKGIVFRHQTCAFERLKAYLLQKAIQGKQTEILEKVQEYQNLHKLHSVLQADYQILQQSYAQTNEKSLALNTKMTQQNSELIEKNEVILKLREQVQSKSSEMEGVTRASKQEKAELERLTKENSDLKEQIGEQEAKVQELENFSQQMKEKTKETNIVQGSLVLHRTMVIFQFKQMSATFAQLREIPAANVQLPKLIKSLFLRNIRLALTRLCHHTLNIQLKSQSIRQTQACLIKLTHSLSEKPKLLKLGFYKWKDSQKQYRQFIGFLRFLNLKARTNLHQIFPLLQSSQTAQNNEKSPSQQKASKFAVTIERINAALKERRKIQIQKRFHNWTNLINLTKSKLLSAKLLRRTLIRHFRALFTSLSLPRQNQSLFITLASIQTRLKLSAFDNLKMSKLHNSLALLSEDLTYKASENQQLKTEMTALQQTNSKINDKNLQLNTKITQLSSDVLQKDQEIHDLKYQLTNQANELEYSLSDTKHKAESAQLQTKRLQKEIGYLRQQLSEKDTRIGDLLQEVENFESNAGLSVMQVQQLQAQLKKAQEMYAKSMSDKSKLQGSEVELKRQVIDMTNNIDTLTEENESLTDQLHQSQQQILQMQERVEALVIENRKINEIESYYTEQEGLYQAQLEELKQAAQQNSREKDAEIEEKNRIIQQLKTGTAQMAKELEHIRNETRQLAESQRASQALSKEKQNLHETLGAENKKLKETNSQLSSQVLKLNRETADLKISLRQSTEAQSRSAQETVALRGKLESVAQDLKRVEAERENLLKSLKYSKSVEQSQTETMIRAMREHCKKLEQELKETQNYLNQQRVQEDNIYALTQENKRLEQELQEVSIEMEECRKEALSSRREVNRVCAEIENYAKILEAMEAKVIEAEDRTLKAEKEREEALSEVYAVRQRYINIIANTDQSRCHKNVFVPFYH